MGMLLAGDIESLDNNSKSLTECKLYTARRTNTLTSFIGLPGRVCQQSKDIVCMMGMVKHPNSLVMKGEA